MDEDILDIINKLKRSTLSGFDKILISDIISGKVKLIFGDEQHTNLCKKLKEQATILEEIADNKEEMREKLEEALIGVHGEIEELEDQIEELEDSAREIKDIIKNL